MTGGWTGGRRQVDDEATLGLMTRFYEQYLKPAPEGGGDAAAALRRAMVSMIVEGRPVQEASAARVVQPSAVPSSEYS